VGNSTTKTHQNEDKQMQHTNITESAFYQVLEIRRKGQPLVAWDFETKTEAERFALEQTKQGKEVVIVYG
jgi:hypothetical protein